MNLFSWQEIDQQCHCLEKGEKSTVNKVAKTIC